MSKAKILVVDDDLKLRQLLVKFLTEQQFAVKAVANTAEMDKCLSREVYDVILLDCMMPGEDGLSACQRLRAEAIMTPILMLSAKGDDVDKIVGLEIGADDYLAKPFNPRELTARIKSLLRRRENMPVGAPQVKQAIIKFGPFQFDPVTRQLLCDGKAQTLTTGEFAVLNALVTHPRQTLTRDKLMHLARGREHEAYDRSIDVQISRLRRLIETDPSKPRYIQTVWGTGYVFVPEETTV